MSSPTGETGRRLVVTTVDSAGRSTVGDDRTLEVDAARRGALVVWATEDGRHARAPRPSSPIPVPGGATFVLLVLPARGSGQSVIPLHTTPTIDFGVVVSGAVTLDLEDGTGVDLGPGDLVVQTATEHGWRNLGTEPCVLAFAMLGLPQSED